MLTALPGCSNFHLQPNSLSKKGPSFFDASNEIPSRDLSSAADHLRHCGHSTGPRWGQGLSSVVSERTTLSISQVLLRTEFGEAESNEVLRAAGQSLLTTCASGSRCSDHF